MLDLITKHKVISIIGMAKNVGKTTTLNYILEKITDKTIGLTSVGRDGEKEDIVSHLPKPRIYIKAGTIVATTNHCLNNSDFTKQILKSTNILTPLGEVVIVKALSDGYVDLAGPSFNEQLKIIVRLLESLGSELTIIDGAFSRKTIANNLVSEAAILCTGAAYDPDINKVVEDTAHIIELFAIEEVHEDLKEDFSAIMHKNKVAIIDKNNELIIPHITTVLNNAKAIVNELSESSKFLIINGAITDELIIALYNNRQKLSQLTIIIKHPTNCLFTKEAKRKLDFTNIRIKCLSKTDIISLTINPTSPMGLSFNELEFKALLKQKIVKPIYNVLRDVNE